MNVSVTLTDTSGALRTLSTCTDFRFSAERYSPASLFYGRFAIDSAPVDIAAVSVSIGGVCVQTGFLDSITCEQTPRGLFCRLYSRPFAALLEQNHIKPGMYTAMTMEKIRNTLVLFSGVSVQPSTKSLNYIVVKDNGNAWDCFVQLCLRLWGVMPYMTPGNLVRYTLHGNPILVTLTPAQLLRASVDCTNETLISDIHMRDLEGNYDVYTAHSDFPCARGITRHRHIGWDQAWLADIPAGLTHRLRYAARGRKAYTLTYAGYHGEQIYDRVSLTGPAAGFTLSGRKISAVEVRGNARSVTTTLRCYEDDYMERNSEEGS